MSFHVDYDNHYSYCGNRISPYNFLKYSHKQWAIFNPKLHYQNRLRHRDYIDLFHQAGFEAVEEQRREGAAVDQETIERLPRDGRFGAYSAAELAVHNALVVVQKRSTVANLQMGGE